MVETGSARETHQFALLAGYGAEAIHPWLAMETLREMADGDAAKEEKYISNFVKAVGKGLCKVMSKMGISTYTSYTGAQISKRLVWKKHLWINTSPAPIQSGRYRPV